MSSEYENAEFKITGHYNPFEKKYIRFYRWKIELKNFIVISVISFPTKSDALKNAIETAGKLNIKVIEMSYEETPNPEFII